MIEDSGAIVQINPWGKKGLVEDIAPLFNGWINELKPDVYVISTSADIGWVVLPFIDPRIATFTIGHNNEDTFYLPLRHYHSFITTAIGVSNEICEQYKVSCHMREEDVASIPYGVEVRQNMDPGSDKGTVELIYVGRLEEDQKKISDLIAIIKKLSEREEPYHIRIVGDGPCKPDLLEQLSAEIKAGKADITGWLSKNEVIKLLRQADIFILTSAFEGFSIALTEAMANGCCPVVTDIKSGNQQLIANGQNGFLIPVGDTHAFTDRLSELIRNRQKLNALRMAAWEKGRQFGVAIMAKNYESCFENALEKGKLNPRNPNKNFPLMSTCTSKYPNWLRRIKQVFVNNLN